MTPEEPWRPGATPEDDAARREAYRRLAEAARRVGMPIGRLAALLRAVARNETETRALLTEVYGVPDSLLDDLLRLRLVDLEDEERS